MRLRGVRGELGETDLLDCRGAVPVGQAGLQQGERCLAGRKRRTGYTRML